MTKKDSKDKRIMGRLERVNLPEFGLMGLEAKVDTGAYRGSLHAHLIEERDIDGVPTVFFTLLDPDHPDYQEKESHTSEFIKQWVMSSNGESEQRYFISTTIELGGESIPVKLSLSNRKSLRRPVLLGRRSIRKYFIVDVNKTFNL